MNYVIGAGGAGSWLTPSLCMLVGRDKVIVVDGDNLEEKNLNRQLFTTADIGRNKAEALADRYGCGAIPDWFSFGDRPYDEHDVLIGCLDNNAGRIAILETCDYSKSIAIIAANETYSAESYAFLPRWKDSQLDPRIRDPELVSEPGNDPRRASIGCTGKAQEETPQLVVANMLASALAMRMFEIWTSIAKRLDGKAREFLPYKLVANQTKLETHRVCDLIQT